MKKIFGITFALAATVVFASCSDELNNSTAEQGQDNTGALPSVEFVPVTFSTSANEEIESKTTYKSRKVYWEDADEISVFSVGSEDVNSKGTVSTITDDNTSAQFTAPADPDAGSYYAVYPYSQTNACDADGNLTVSIPSQQTAVQGGFMSGSNTSVAYSVHSAEGNVLQFRNVTALIGISFANDADAAATKSITIRAKKNDTEYWGLTGTGKVRFNSDMEPVIVEEGDVQSVTLVPPGDAFVYERTMFIPVYAVGDITGLEVTYLGQDGKEYVKTNSTAATLGRNKILNCSGITDPYDPLPHTFTLKLDFSKEWPFNEKIVKKEDQEVYVKKNEGFYGESYTYTYDRYPDPDDGREMKTDFDFNISKGLNESDFYEYSDEGYLSLGYTPSDNYVGTIRLPGIEGRYLTQVRVVKYGTSNDRVYLLDPETDKGTSIKTLGEDNVWICNLYADKCETVTKNNATYVYNDTVKAALAKRYEIAGRCGNDTNVRIVSIELTYSKTKPGNCPTE